MQKIQWKSRRTLILVTTAIVFFLVLRIRTYNHTDFVVLTKVKPMDAWEFVADFNNMKYLNPTIVDFNILSDSGNFNHWQYTTQYSENLSHWPYLYNVALASFDIKASSQPDVYYINSLHTTCLLFGYICLDAKSEFKFSNSNTGKGAICEETIAYECPAFLSSFCRREVEYQRKSIMGNLKKHFLNKVDLNNNKL